MMKENIIVTEDFNHSSCVKCVPGVINYSILPAVRSHTQIACRPSTNNAPIIAWGDGIPHTRVSILKFFLSKLRFYYGFNGFPYELFGHKRSQRKMFLTRVESDSKNA